MGYHVILPEIWDQMLEASFTQNDRELYIYSFSNDACTASGIYLFSRGIAGKRLQLEEENILETLQNIQSKGFIKYDAPTSVIFVRAKYKSDPGNTRPLYKIRILKEFLRTSNYPFWIDFWAKYPELLRWLKSSKYNKRQEELNQCLNQLAYQWPNQYANQLAKYCPTIIQSINQEEEGDSYKSPSSSPPSLILPPKDAGGPADSELAQRALRQPDADQEKSLLRNFANGDHLEESLDKSSSQIPEHANQMYTKKWEKEKEEDELDKAITES